MIDMIPYYLVIGRVIVQLQHLEYSYKEFYHIFLDEDFKYSNKKNNSFYKLLKTFKSKIKVRYKKEPSILKELIPIIVESIDLNRERNKLVHSCWIAYSYNNQDLLLNYRGNKSDGFKPFKKNGILIPNKNYRILTLDEIENIGDRIEKNHFKLLIASIPFGIKKSLRNPYINKEALLESWKDLIDIKLK